MFSCILFYDDKTFRLPLLFQCHKDCGWVSQPLAFYDSRTISIIRRNCGWCNGKKTRYMQSSWEKKINWLKNIYKICLTKATLARLEPTSPLSEEGLLWESNSTFLFLYVLSFPLPFVVITLTFQISVFTQKKCFSKSQTLNLSKSENLKKQPQYVNCTISTNLEPTRNCIRSNPLLQKSFQCQ